MGAVATEMKQPKLSDGRVVRAYVDDQALLAKGKKTFTQKEFFQLVSALRTKGPSNETIMDNPDHDDSINKAGVWKEVSVNDWWRTRRYAVYRRGFEEEFDLALGKTVVYIEKGADHTFEVPDVKHPSNRDKSLRQATGMAVFDVYKLDYDSDKRVVRVTSDFNPETDVQVVDVMRPREWALVDANGYPLRNQKSSDDNADARYSWVRHSDQFEGKSTGFHGSVARGVLDDRGRGVVAVYYWAYDSGVALVQGRKAAATRDVSVVTVRQVEVSGPAYRAAPSETRSPPIDISGALLDACDAELSDMANADHASRKKLTAIRKLVDTLKAIRI